ncbi:ATPase V [Enterococcus sp. JM4C]|uniref:ATPase V n=1 Tax=Candidatus Enterococcus huntleyi TaxID=1857217 RepID=UPI00137A1D45|nr:ATPase V [Enterococcus sp. JM4C]KAF1295719.1 ATPase V [Enterococcus sp. JM4C]
MDSIEKIIQQMNTQASEERAVLEATEKAQQTQNFEKEKLQIEQEEQQRRQKRLQQVKQQYKQIENRQQIDNRQQLLTEKQQFLSRLFNEALQEMENWTEEQHCSFAQAALLTLPLTGQQLFLAGEKTAAYFTDAWLTEMNQALPYTLTLSEEKLVNKAGFLVDDAGVQYNFLYNNLLQDIENEMRFEMATYLFG